MRSKGSIVAEAVARTVMTTVVFCLAWISPALAVDTSKVYASGILVTIFLGVCALIVVAQMVPALMLLMGAIKALFSGKARKEAAVPVDTRGENA